MKSHFTKYNLRFSSSETIFDVMIRNAPTPTWKKSHKKHSVT